MSALAPVRPQPATLVEALFPWVPGRTLTESLKADRGLGHLAAVACAGAPGLDEPVRWAMTGEGMVLRASPKALFAAPPGWAEALGAPRVRSVQLQAGDEVRFEVSVVPERAVRRAGRRGKRVPVLEDVAIMEWLLSRLTRLPSSPDDMTFDRMRISYEREEHTSEALECTWHAVRASVEAVVVDPLAVCRLIVGHQRAYGFGLPVFS